MLSIFEGDKCSIRVYRSAADRKRAIAQLKRHGFNYFVCYKDVQGAGLNYGVANWVRKGGTYLLK